MAPDWSLVSWPKPPTSQQTQPVREAVAVLVQDHLGVVTAVHVVRRAGAEQEHLHDRRLAVGQGEHARVVRELRQRAGVRPVVDLRVDAIVALEVARRGVESDRRAQQVVVEAAHEVVGLRGHLSAVLLPVAERAERRAEEGRWRVPGAAAGRAGPPRLGAGGLVDRVVRPVGGRGARAAGRRDLLAGPRVRGVVVVVGGVLVGVGPGEVAAQAGVRQRAAVVDVGAEVPVDVGVARPCAGEVAQRPAGVGPPHEVRPPQHRSGTGVDHGVQDPLGVGEDQGRPRQPVPARRREDHELRPAAAPRDAGHPGGAIRDPPGLFGADRRPDRGHGQVGLGRAGQAQQPPVPHHRGHRAVERGHAAEVLPQAHVGHALARAVLLLGPQAVDVARVEPERHSLAAQEAHRHGAGPGPGAALEGPAEVGYEPGRAGGRVELHHGAAAQAAVQPPLGGPGGGGHRCPLSLSRHRRPGRPAAGPNGAAGRPRWLRAGSANPAAITNRRGRNRSLTASGVGKQRERKSCVDRK